ncbi:MAG: tRNA (cytidine(56)-2'-O)-methyltransferase [Promethearchaeota archaeon]
MVPIDRRIVVLKLDHRPERDKRITTHVGLTARAFGATEFWVSGLKDPKISETIQKVTSQWGNQAFKTTSSVKWRNRIQEWKEQQGAIIHLTMYGLHVDEVIEQIRSSQQPLLIVVGGPKVPSEIFHLADFNVAIGHQPHSEVAALALFLDRLFEGRSLYQKFSDAKIEIQPTNHGKQVKKSD